MAFGRFENNDVTLIYRDFVTIIFLTNRYIILYNLIDSCLLAWLNLVSNGFSPSVSRISFLSPDPFGSKNTIFPPATVNVCVIAFKVLLILMLP